MSMSRSGKVRSAFWCNRYHRYRVNWTLSWLFLCLWDNCTWHDTIQAGWQPVENMHTIWFIGWQTIFFAPSYRRRSEEKQMHWGLSTMIITTGKIHTPPMDYNFAKRTTFVPIGRSHCSSIAIVWHVCGDECLMKYCDYRSFCGCSFEIFFSSSDLLFVCDFVKYMGSYVRT